MIRKQPCGSGFPVRMFHSYRRRKYHHFQRAGFPRYGSSREVRRWRNHAPIHKSAREVGQWRKPWNHNRKHFPDVINPTVQWFLTGSPFGISVPLKDMSWVYLLPSLLFFLFIPAPIFWSAVLQIQLRFSILLLFLFHGTKIRTTNPPPQTLETSMCLCLSNQGIEIFFMISGRFSSPLSLQACLSGGTLQHGRQNREKSRNDSARCHVRGVTQRHGVRRASYHRRTPSSQSPDDFPGSDFPSSRYIRRHLMLENQLKNASWPKHTCCFTNYINATNRILLFWIKMMI